jgi:hypothetical protein
MIYCNIFSVVSFDEAVEEVVLLVVSVEDEVEAEDFDC